MAQVGCAGILVADLLCGAVSALPRPGKLLAVDDIPAKAGGCAANVAIDLSRQGIRAKVAGCVGRDAAAETPLSALRAHGVECAGIVWSARLPTSKTVVLLVAGEDRRLIPSFGAVFRLGGLFAMPGIKVGGLVDLLDFCRRSGIVTVVTVVLPKAFDQNHALEGLSEAAS
jgi:hypothetical protein